MQSRAQIILSNTVCGWLLLLVCPVLLLGCAHCAGKSAAPSKATQPAIRPDGWIERHKEFLAYARQHPQTNIVFIGDSITDQWRWTGEKIWEQYWAPKNSANFGFCGDRTQHVLWRIQNGELDGLRPKVVVLMIGVNNITDQDENIFEAITLIVDEIQRKLPAAKILLMGILPTTCPAVGPPVQVNAKIRAINAALAGQADNEKIYYLDLGGLFIDSNGAIPAALMPDGLHPSQAGYALMAPAMEKSVRKLLADEK